MNVRVLKCSHDTRVWYNFRIGEIFNVYRKEYDYVTGITYIWVRTGDEYNTLNWIDEDDVEYVKE